MLLRLALATGTGPEAQGTLLNTSDPSSYYQASENERGIPSVSFWLALSCGPISCPGLLLS